MKYFIEVTLLENRDITLPKLWSKIYSQLHLRLVEAKNTRGEINLGVSFPRYQFDKDENIGILGNKFRLFAPSILAIEQINLPKYLKSFSDYVHITSIHETPKNIEKYHFYKRKRIVGEAEMSKKIPRLATYKAKKENMNLDETLIGYKDWSISKAIYPYIGINSSTSKQHFRLYIEKIETTEFTENYHFSTYGLSAISSVPDF